MASRRAFTLADLAFAIALTASAVAILIPSLTQTRVADGEQGSRANLRTLGAAHAAYAADWNGRQLTYVVDEASAYGEYADWWQHYAEQHGSDGDWWHPGNHPGVDLGWGRNAAGGVIHYYYSCVQSANASLCLPIGMAGWSGFSTEYFGAFRFPNAAQFNAYLGDRYYDEVFYAPKDDVVVDAVDDGFDAPDAYWPFANVHSSVGDIPAWSSYCMSPAAMFSPDVLRHDDPDDDTANGYVDPFEIDHGFESPGYFQAMHPDLKTHVLEHHWLQNRPEDFCNPAFDPGTYGEEGCEPYYFNHGLASVPMTLFYDGHVDGLPVAQAIADDAIVREQMNDNWGLWSKDTPWGADGYLSEFSYDASETSFHILTTDGIQGRDRLSPSSARGGPVVRRGHDASMRRPVRRRKIDPSAEAIEFRWRE